MSIIENLNNLEISIINAKQTLVNNINNKGGDASEDETLTEIANKVLDIPTNSGGDEKPLKLQDKTVGITENGTSEVVPDDGFDGMAKVIINASITGNTSALDFSIIGYDSNLSAEIISQYNDDIAYSKTLLDAWNPSNTSAMSLYFKNEKLVYAPNIDTSNVLTMKNMFQSCTRLTTVPLYDTKNVTDITNLFAYCSNLKTVPLFNTENVTTMESAFDTCKSLSSVPQFDTSNVTSMKRLFYYCSSLKTVPLFNTKNVTTLNNTFYYCTGLTSVPLFNTENVTDGEGLFYGCSSLKTIPQFNTSNLNIITNFFNGCTSLTSIPLLDFGNVTKIDSFIGYSSLTTLTTLGGFKDLKIDWNDNYGLFRCPNLTYESVMNVINNLYDFRGNGDETTTRTLKLNSNSLALLTDDDKAVATSKGWILS